MRSPRYVENNIFLLLNRNTQYNKHKLTLNRAKSDPFLTRKITLPKMAHYDHIIENRNTSRKSNVTATQNHIQSQNMKIVHKILEIGERPSEFPKKDLSFTQSTLNKSFVKQRNQEILNQNIQQKKRIQGVRSSYKKQTKGSFDYGENIRKFSKRNQSRVGSFLSKLNINQNHKSFLFDDQSIILKKPTENSIMTQKDSIKQILKSKQSLESKTATRKFQNTDSISILAANLSRLKVGGLGLQIQKLKLPKIS